MVARDGRATRCRDPERSRQPKPSREMVVVPVFESGRKLSTSAERFRGLATAYADAKLGKQKLCLGCVLVSRGGSFVYCFDISMGYQAIKRLFWLLPDFRPIF